MRRSDYFDRYDRMARLNSRGPCQDLEDAGKLRMNHSDRSYAADIAGTCFMLMFALALLAGVLQFLRWRDQAAALQLQAALVSRCDRCHALALQSPPPLATYKQYKKNHPSPAEQRALLAELVR